MLSQLELFFFIVFFQIRMESTFGHANAYSESFYNDCIESYKEAFKGMDGHDLEDVCEIMHITITTHQ